MSLTMGNFKSADYRLAPWPPKREGTPSKLQKSGTLSRSFHLEVASDHATVKATPIYAAIHHFGGPIKGKPVHRLRWAPGRWATASQVNMPARQFFPVVDGRLTAKAEQRIAAAGQRPLARQAGQP